MGQLFATIRQLVIDGKYVVGQHASERLEERGLLEWQAVVGMEDAELIVEDELAVPNPKVEVSEMLPDEMPGPRPDVISPSMPRGKVVPN